MSSTNKEWLCPFCDFKVPYGESCPGNWKDCDRGKKNIVHEMAMKKRNTTPDPVKGIGISEISDENEEM